MNKTTILLCKCRSVHFNQNQFNDFEDALSKLMIDLVVVDDLCAACISQPEEIKELFSSNQNLIVLACQPRAVKNLLIQNGIDTKPSTIINILAGDFNSASEQLTTLGIAKGKAFTKNIVSELKVPSWFPIIDRERCTACGRCAKFCLFGVYRFEENNLQVINPLNCKNNCPACARTCPSSSIIFPKIAERGVISGADPKTQPSDLHLPAGNLTDRLNDRKTLRSSILKTSVIDLAEKERSKFLTMVNKPDIND